tara:strand:- start:719 stop:1042 length:324 start_codon:yes stop_codon:yes gene_type:complete
VEINRTIINTFAKIREMSAPRFPSFFKNKGPKSFEFKPRYYDARKERLEEMKRNANTEKPVFVSENFREKARDKWRSERSRSVNASNIRVFAIVVILFFIAYLIITY